MPRPAWFPRILSSLFAAGGLFYSLGMLAGFLVAPVSGMDASTIPGAPGQPGTLVVNTVERGGAAAGAGIQPGQRLRFVSNGDAIAYAFAHAGTTVHFITGASRPVVLRFEERTVPLGEGLRFLAQALLAAIALLIALRAWRDEQARRLAVLFAALSNYVDSALLPVGWDALFVLVAWLVGSPWAIVAFARFGTGYPSTPPLARRVIRPLAAVLGVAYLISFFLAALPQFGGLPAGCWAAVALMGLVGLVLSYGRARGVERQRIGWVLVSFAIGLGPIALYEMYVFATGAPEVWTWQALPFIVMPLGMAYATLRLRVIDLGFALTRAGVFSIMTLLIAGIFGVLESLAEKFLSEASHTESFLIELVITLTMVYIVRYFHHHIEHAIEHVVFAARNRRIKLITSIADALGVATEPGQISATLVERLRNDAAIPAAVYVEDGGALRHDAGDDQIHPDSGGNVRVFPLETFKRTRGTLVCELPPQDEFAPDEASALQRLARDAAVARESARVEELTQELKELRERLDRLEKRAP